MKNLTLQVKYADSSVVTQIIPNITVQPFYDKDSQQLAVIFDVAKSPTEHIYANFPTYNPLTLTRIMQEDYLWQSNCYELFLAFDNTPDSPYIEINFSPAGYFNIYHFDSYRKPEQMPPRRLRLTDKERQQLFNCYNIAQDWKAVFWQKSLPSQVEMRKMLEQRFILPSENHRLGMMIDLSMLAKILNLSFNYKIWFNACVVYVGENGEEQNLAYFAPQHANPPDFHHKHYWLAVDF